MAHFYIYGDESGKLAKSDFTSFCGYVSHASEFERVSVEWNNCRFAWGVPPVHMSCVMDPTRDKSGEWQKIQTSWGMSWESKRELMLREFAAVILNSNIACTGAVVDAAHFRKMPNSEWKSKMRDPLFLGFWMLLMESLDKIDRITKSLSVAVILDDDPENAKQCYDLLSGLKGQFPRVRERISAITFANDKEYPALQMADMIAFEARSLMVQRMTTPTAPPSSLYMALTRRLCHQPLLWNGEFLDKAAQLPPDDARLLGKSSRSFTGAHLLLRPEYGSQTSAATAGEKRINFTVNYCSTSSLDEASRNASWY